MFEIEYKTDCSGKEIAILKLKQGDTGSLKVNPKSKSTGEKIDFSLSYTKRTAENNLYKRT